MKAQFPRTVLMSLGGPDAVFKLTPKIVAKLPEDKLLWVSFWGKQQGSGRGAHLGLNPSRLHWRLRGSWMDYYWSYDWQVRSLLPRVLAAVRAFDPKVLWTILEPGAVNLAWHVHQATGIPVHVTVHDAFETAKFMMTKRYYPFYALAAKRLLKAASSMDGISSEMVSFIEAQHRAFGEGRTTVFHPAIDRMQVPGEAESAVPSFKGSVRRIGLCGSMRENPWQWSVFLQVLSRCPYEFELISFAYKDLFPDVPLPPNVRLLSREPVPTEGELVIALQREGVHLGYVGLWKEPQYRLFAQTSLSEKTKTFAAAGLPIVLNGPRGSVAWRLLNDYGAGICMDESSLRLSDALGPEDWLQQLLSGEGQWSRFARGARRLCTEEFDLDRNVSSFVELLGRVALSGT